MPFVMLPGSEEALMANDWALFKLLAGQNANKEQVDEYIERLSQPGAHCVRRSDRDTCSLCNISCPGSATATSLNTATRLNL